MKTIYEKPSISVLYFEATDVIATSGIEGDGNLSGSTPDEEG